MLGFRYVCGRHQQLFVDAVERAGCRDPERMEEVRRRLLAWFSENYPRMVLDQFNRRGCLGCAIEAAHIDPGAMRQAIRDLVRAVEGG
jgi:hypothetical protein